MIYTNDVESKVNDIFEEKQANARYQIAARREKIYSEIPEIKQIEEDISKEGIKITMSSVKGIEYTPLKDIKKLAEKRDELLKSHGYPVDYIQNVYECKKCLDSGYIDGKICDCRLNLLRKESLKNSNIAPALLEISINDFDINLYPDTVDENGNNPREQMLYIFGECDKFIRDFGKKEVKNILFYGMAGLGKTFMSAAIAREIYNKGYSVLYYSAKQLLTLMTDYEFGRIPDKKPLYDMVFSADLLIIDDLGSEQQTSFATSALFDIINTRTLNGKKIIINTNLEAKDIQNLYSARIFSRLNEFESLKFIGKDIRVIKNS